MTHAPFVFRFWELGNFPSWVFQNWEITMKMCEIYRKNTEYSVGKCSKTGRKVFEQMSVFSKVGKFSQLAFSKLGNQFPKLGNFPVILGKINIGPMYVCLRTDEINFPAGKFWEIIGKFCMYLGRRIHLPKFHRHFCVFVV